MPGKKVTGFFLCSILGTLHIVRVWGSRHCELELLQDLMLAQELLVWIPPHTTVMGGLRLSRCTKNLLEARCDGARL